MHFLIPLRAVHVTLAVCISATLCACSGLWPTSLSNAHRVQTPAVNLQGDALHQYHLDAANCQRVLTQRHGDRIESNNAITDLRKCLIDKGYVLLN